MPHPSLGHYTPTLTPGPGWFISMLLCLSATQTHCKDAPVVPQEVSLSRDTVTQQLFISWHGGTAITFDLIILRTDLKETVFNETVTVNQENGRHHWNWTSVEPLECTSLTVQLRSRDGLQTSVWSTPQIMPGMDFPIKNESLMFPQDRVVMAGANTTFCCILGAGKSFDNIRYNTTIMNATRLSERSYAITKTNQQASRISGTNVICISGSVMVMGASVFVGYPPLPSDLVCETRDMTSALCHWDRGRDTHLYGNSRKTYYTLNGRKYVDDRQLQMLVCRLPEWEGNWTLIAENPLGQYSLNYSAELQHRVRPVAPTNLISVPHAWNATLLWDWDLKRYHSLALICQVEITSAGQATTLTFSGVGLRSVALLDLHPDEEFSVKICCGSQRSFWKWGDWSKSLVFKTSIDIPETPDVWVSINKDNTGKVMWKKLTQKQSHGQITGYELTLWSPENILHTEAVTHSIHTVPINLTHMATISMVMANVSAKNGAGLSPPASVAIPLHMPNVEPSAVSRVAYTEGGFPLSWESDANASCGYVVDWRDASCLQDCLVNWTKMAAGSTNVSIPPDNLQRGVRYSFSLYSLSPEASELLQRWQGYIKELVPSSSVPHLITKQDNSDIQLSWGKIPLVNQRGFLLGYNIYMGPGLKRIANVGDPDSHSYRVKDLPISSYKFTVKAYTSVGEDTGATASITMESYTDWLLLEMLTSLGTMTCFLVLVTFICYKKRKWVKKAFYPDIPEPKLAGDWSRTQAPLSVKPSANSLVHVEEPEWDSSKEKLVVIPEEEEDEEQGIHDEPVDTDEPTSIRYYNQVIDERPIRPRFPDSSASSTSSMDSGRTDVTYTGIQTSGSSLAFQMQPQFPSDGHQPQVDHPVSLGGGGGYRPQVQPGIPGQCPGQENPQPFLEPQFEKGSSFGGYQPQCSWQVDSPVETEGSGGMVPTMGSPTSVASTQFLLPESEEDTKAKSQGSSTASTWLHNLLSSTKP